MGREPETFSVHLAEANQMRLGLSGNNYISSSSLEKIRSRAMRSTGSRVLCPTRRTGVDLMDRLLPLDPFLIPSQFQYIPPQSSHPSTYPPSCEGKKPRVRRCTIDQRVLIFGVGGQLCGRGSRNRSPRSNQSVFKRGEVLEGYFPRRLTLLVGNM